MRVCMYSTRSYDRESFDSANHDDAFEFRYVEDRLIRETAVLAHGCEAVCLFVNDDGSAESLGTGRGRSADHRAVVGRLQPPRSRHSRTAGSRGGAGAGLLAQRRRRAHRRADPRPEPSHLGLQTGGTATSRSRGSWGSTSRARRPASSAPAGSVVLWPACCGTSDAVCSPTIRSQTVSWPSSVSTTSTSTASGPRAISSR